MIIRFSERYFFRANSLVHPPKDREHERRLISLWPLYVHTYKQKKWMYTYKYILEKHSVCVWEVNVHVQSCVHYHFVFTMSFVLQYDWTALFVIILCLLWNVIFHFFCCVLAWYHFYQIFSVFYVQWFLQSKVTWMFKMNYPESSSHK